MYLTDFSDHICVYDRCIDVTGSWKQILWKINLEPLALPAHPSITCITGQLSYSILSTSCDIITARHCILTNPAYSNMKP